MSSISRSAAAFLAATLVLSPLWSQDAASLKKPLTFELATRNPGAFYARGLPGLKWHPDGEHLTWVTRLAGKGIVLVRQPLAGGAPEVVLGMEALTEAAKAAGLESVSPGHLVGLSWIDAGSLRMEVGRGLYRIQLDPLKVTRLFEVPEGASEVTWAPGDRQVAYMRDFDVAVIKADGTTFPVTQVGYADLTHGKSVSREELGIKNGLWWDPEGRRLAFYREDLRPVEPTPLADYTVTPAKARVLRYPMAGRKGSIVSVGVYDSGQDGVLYLDTDPEADEYLTGVTWHPSGKKIYLVRVNRDQNEATVAAYDALTGKHLADLFTEKDPEWIEPEVGPLFLPDGSGDFLWFSPRDGFNHLYWYAADGELKRQVTDGDFDIEEFVDWSEYGKSFFFVATGSDPRHRHFFRASMGGSQEQLTAGRGHHTVTLAPGGGHFLDDHSHLEQPLVTTLHAIDGSVVRKVHEARTPLTTHQLAQQALFTTETADGQTIYGHVLYPPKLEKGKKYPVINYVYGGPHAQLVQDTWLGSRGRWMPWMHYMATQGYVIFRADGRGTPNRGIEWEQEVFRRLGTLEIEDQVAALDHVIGMGFADPEHVGVTGWSYGGYMTLSLMTRKGDRYHVGVAGSPVTDWKWYETGYGERYMDTPETNPEGYAEAAPSKHLDGLKGHLLVVHGSSDDVVVPQHTLRFASDCIENGKPLDYMIYPGQEHGFAGPYFLHCLEKMTRYFDEHLKAKEPAKEPAKPISVKVSG